MLEGDKQTQVDEDVRVPVGVARPETEVPGAVEGRRDLLPPAEEGRFTPLAGNCTKHTQCTAYEIYCFSNTIGKQEVLYIDFRSYSFFLHVYSSRIQ